MKRAVDELGVTEKVSESKSEADYEPNISNFVSQDCDLIIPVGFLLDSATQTSAKANPDQHYAIVDVDFFDTAAKTDITYDNVEELTFKTDQAAFLAGYTAAGMTKSGKVGTYGGIQIPTVTIFMDGFLAGVQQYNKDNSKNVEVLGWDGTTACSPATSTTRTRARTPPSHSSTRAPTSSCRWPDRSVRGRSPTSRRSTIPTSRSSGSTWTAAPRCPMTASTS